jgi:hypothetical protein
MTTIAVLGNLTGTKTDFSRAVTSFGGIAPVFSSVTVPATTAADAYVAIAPHVAGTRFVFNSESLRVADLDTATNVTIDFGFVFPDDTTDAPDIIVDGSNAPQAGGFCALINTAGWHVYTLPADGYFCARIKGAPTTTAGAVTANYGVFF